MQVRGSAGARRHPGATRHLRGQVPRPGPAAHDAPHGSRLAGDPPLPLRFVRSLALIPTPLLCFGPPSQELDKELSTSPSETDSERARADIKAREKLLATLYLQVARMHCQHVLLT